MSMSRPLLRLLRSGLRPAAGRPLARRAAATTTDASWSGGVAVHRHWAVASWAAGGAVALVLAETQRRRMLHCASLKRVALGKVEDFEESDMREVKVGTGDSTATVLVHRHGGVFYATSPTCFHSSGHLKLDVSASGGKGIGPTVSCSLHASTFDLKTGKHMRGPAMDAIPTYQVEVRDGMVHVQLPNELVNGTANHQNVPQTTAGRNLKDTRVFALIGGGAASLAAAETLREEGFGGRILMLTKEAHLPYDRVVLSKDLEKTAEDLALRTEDFYKEHDIEVMHNALVTKLDAAEQKVFYKVSGAKEECLAYDRVLVASGGLPRKLFCPGATLKGIHTLRTPEDAAEITKYVKRGQKMIVVGGSFIGMEIASSLRAMGCDVAVIAMETVPFERVLGKKVGAAFARLLQKEGVQWYGSAQVRHFRGNDCVNGVELEDGEVLPADCVVVGAGVLPNTRFVSGTALDKNGGIVVGPLLNSEACPTLFAAGDVCTYPSVRTGKNVRIEHWDVATQQGRVAAKNMLGQFQPFTTIPFFWSGLFKKNLRFVGYAPEVLDRVIIEGDAVGMEFISYYTENDEVTAVATVNRDPVSVACSELIRRGKMPKVSELMLGVANADVIMQRLKDLKADEEAA